MLFILGFIAGIVFCLLMAVLLVFFRKPIEQRLSVAEKQLEQAGPRPKGFIYMPPTEDEEARQAKIEENQQNGRPTKLSEL